MPIPKGYEQTMYCSPAKNGKYYHIKRSRDLLSVYGCRREEAIEVIVREGVGYWAWWDNKRQELRMIYPHQVQLHVCFPYGIQAAIDQELGIRVQVEIIPKVQEM